MDESVAHHYWRLHRCIKHQTEITIMMTTFASKRKQPVKMIVFVWIANQKRTYKCVSMSWKTGKSKRETVCLIGWSKNSTILLNGKLNATGGKFPMHIFQFSVHGGPGHQNHFPMSSQIRLPSADFQIKMKGTQYQCQCQQRILRFFPINIFINKLLIIFTHARMILT